MIGIIGGVGPLAGVDLVKKIIEETNVETEQEQLPLLLSSQPHRIPNTIDYLESLSNNPSTHIGQIIEELAKAGATTIAIPSNAVHSPQIFEGILEYLGSRSVHVKLFHLIEETAKYIDEYHHDGSIGILSSTQTKHLGIYQYVLATNKINSIEPDITLQENINQALLDESFGIQQHPSPITHRAHDILVKSLQTLKHQGASGILATSPEFIHALKEDNLFGMPLLDPFRILARALIKHIDSTKLRPIL